MRALQRFLVVAARPIPIAGNVATIAGWGITGVSLIGGGVVLGLRVSPAAAVALVLGVLLLASVAGGVRLAHELEGVGDVREVETELVAVARSELEFAVSQGGPLTISSERVDAWRDWRTKTAEYIETVLGPAAAADFRSGPDGWFYNRIAADMQWLVRRAEQLTRGDVRVTATDLRRAATKRHDNELMQQLLDAAGARLRTT